MGICRGLYAAREVNTFGVSSEGLANDLNTAVPGKASYAPTPAHAAEAVRAIAREGDSVVVMGAGDVIKVTASLFA